MPSAAARLVTLADGENLIDALAEACGKADGWLSAVGHVDSVEIRVAGEGADVRKQLRGRLTLAQLNGPFGGPYFATLSRHTSLGAELVAGQLLAARSAGVTASLWTAQGSVRDLVDAAPPREVAPEAPKAAPTAPAASGWAAAAQAAAADLAEEEEEPQRPVRGDLVRHFAFGLCEVLQDTGDRLKLRDVQGQGRIREIAVDMLVISPAPDHNGKRVFKLTRKS
ncbi:MAG: hypothetical protein EOO73_14490 [Myxococcales bacterium]|nr:MAG: hypothetical protein EOO73_14490 [Myxococcales bacterium]